MLTPRWIIYSEKLFKESQSKNRKGAEVVLTVGTKKKTDRLVKNGLNFGYIRKSVLYFQEADFRIICYRCCKMGHEKPEIYGNKFSIYKIYGRDYHTNNYTCNILIYKARKGKKCLHDLVKCGNYININ